MAGEKNWADLEVARAVDVNDILAEQVIITSSSFGAPWLGKHVYREDRDLLYRYDGTSWKSYPGGLIAVVSSTGTGIGYFISGTEVLVNGSQITFNAVSGENYAFEGNFLVASSAADYYSVHMNIDSAIGSYTHFGLQRDIHCATAGIPSPVSFREVFTSATGSTRLKVTINHAAGSGFGAVPVGGDFSITHLGAL